MEILVIIILAACLLVAVSFAMGVLRGSKSAVMSPIVMAHHQPERRNNGGTILLFLLLGALLVVLLAGK
jgi:hypothetical protein